MNVLVCDDDPQALGWITSLLAGPCREIRARLVSASHPETLNDLSEFDLAFLDIDMKGLDGLTLARRLRDARPDAIIVFVTNFIQYAPEGYEVQAFRYLLKPALEEKLPACFALAVEELHRRRQIVTFRASGEEIELPVQKILYFESEQRSVAVHLSGWDREVCRFAGSLTQIANRMEGLGFLRIHRSYLVNMACIRKLQYGSLELKDGTQLPVSKKNYAQLKQQYLLWKGRTTWRLS